MKKNTPALFLFISLLSLINSHTKAQINSYVTVNGHNFFLAGSRYSHIGTNYWYGGLLGLVKNKEKGIDRLRTELDFLKEKGVINLRVLAGAEGEGLVNGAQRIQPALQTGKGIFNEHFLDGLDILLSEMNKRNMKAVLFLSNNWEWSGGFLQYLQWNGLIEDSILRRKLTWDETRDYVSKFYTCDSCKSDYLKQVSYIISHINSISKIKYVDEPAIMGWELTNEPRPMRPAVIIEYKKWTAEVAAIIKSKDKNHLVTIGTEGYIGTENSGVYEAIHADKNIDYLTIHIWPKNWEWFTGKDIARNMDSIIYKTRSYINRHKEIARKLNKPLVIEEFGLPRDGHAYNIESTTSSRDKYYQVIFELLAKSRIDNDVISGVNFWSYGGIIKPSHLQWKEGDDYIGDPPMEEQGLNAVFNSDKSTWSIIESFSR